MKVKKQSEAQAVPRPNFNSSRLVRLLADLVTVGGAESKQAFAQRLGQWVSFTDAITLHSALDAGTAPASFEPSTAQSGAQSEAKTASHAAVKAEFLRVRAAMVDLINRGCSPAPGAARIKFPVPQPDVPQELVTAYSPFHRFFLALQREMDAAVGSLRAKVRQTLAAASPALGQLVTLDAALAQILADRERRLLATVPVLLEKRFTQLLKAHQQAFAASGQLDDPAAWMRPGAWLANFRDELRAVLLAELDLRLQPVMGLIETFGNEAIGQT